MNFEAKITPVVIVSCILAVVGKFMIGYGVGICVGVTSMDDFLKKFSPVVYNQTHSENHDSNYCKYDNQKLQLVTSSHYLAGLIATFLASHTIRKLGHRLNMIIAGMFYLAGVVLNASAENLCLVITGRVLLGCGVGIANLAIPLFLSEIAPTRNRGCLNVLIQLNVSIGILIANLINYGTNQIEGGWGWRLSVGLTSVPALILTGGSFLVTDTPKSLIERGLLEDGKAVLRRIRGTDNIDSEFNDIFLKIKPPIEHPFQNLLRRRNRPPLVIAVLFQIFQQLTGINAIIFYAPVLFNTLGFNNLESLCSAVLIAVINFLATFISIYYFDKFKRRSLLLQAGFQMFLSQIVIATVLRINITDHSSHLGIKYAIIVVVMLCSFVAAFGWSWGVLGWLIPSEIFPLEARSAGQSVTVCVNLFFTFVIAQASLSMLCHLKFGIFLFFSGWVLVMSLFVVFFLPETKNVPIEEMSNRVWKHHWFWKRFIEPPIEVELSSDLTR